MNKTIHMPCWNLLCCRRENKAPKQDWLVYKKHGRIQQIRVMSPENQQQYL